MSNSTRKTRSQGSTEQKTPPVREPSKDRKGKGSSPPAEEERPASSYELEKNSLTDDDSSEQDDHNSSTETSSKHEDDKRGCCSHALRRRPIHSSKENLADSVSSDSDRDFGFTKAYAPVATKDGNQRMDNQRVLEEERRGGSLKSDDGGKNCGPRSHPQELPVDKIVRYNVCCIIAAGILLAAVVSLMVIGPCTFPNIEEKQCQKSDNPAEDIYKQSAGNVTGQTGRFWKVIKSNVSSTTGTDDNIKSISEPWGERPACVVITPEETDGEAEQRIKSLSYHSACALNGDEEALILHGDDFIGEHAKSALEDKLGPWFSDGHRVVVIHNIDRLSVETAMLFYKFCDDNPDPVNPKTLLYLTVIHRRGETIDNEWLDSRLRASWSYDEDVISPILSRVGHSVAVMTNGSNSEN